jgi:hypothetical protein
MNRNSLFFYLIGAAFITIFCGLVYATVQQNYRTGANDPQVQLAIDIRQRLEQGQSINSHFPADTVDLGSSLGLFCTLFDKQGQALRSSGLLDGKFPQLPRGVFASTLSLGEDRVSWQPRPGVRMAMVIEPVHSGNAAFVAVGRSLLEVEVREHNLLVSILACWILCLGVLVLTAIAQFFLFRK